MPVIKIILAITFFGSVAWSIASPGYESAIAAATSLSALIGSFFVDKKKKAKSGQSQEIANNGFGIQAGNDVNVRDIQINGKESDAE